MTLFSPAVKPLHRYEFWSSELGNCYTFFRADPEDERPLLEPDAKLLWSVEATSWFEAQQHKCRYLGLEPYRAPEGTEDIVHSG